MSGSSLSAAIELSFNARALPALVKLVSVEDFGSKMLEVTIEAFDGKRHVIGMRGHATSEAGLAQAGEEFASAANDWARHRKQKLMGG